jgi:hypothetical protein
MWYVSRGGAVEGPFPEDQLRGALARGELAGTLVCPVGGTEWHPAESALGAPPAAATYASPPAYGAPQAGGQYGAPQGAPQYGAPQGGPGYGAQPQQGAPQYGAPAGQPYGAQPQQGGPPQGYMGAPTVVSATDATPPKQKRSIVLGVVVAAVLLLLVGGGGALLFMALGKPAAHLAQSVPKSATVYAEMPSFKRSLLSLAGVKVFDPGKVDNKKTSDDVSGAIVNAFGLSKSDAASLALSLDSGAVVARGANKDAVGAGLLSAGSAGPVEALLKTSRFSPDGSFGKGGKAYKLAAMAPGPAGTSPLEKSLREMTTGHAKLVWFADKSLLVFGDEAMVKDIGDVIEGGAESLEKRETFVQAKKQFEPGADFVVFVDEDIIKENAKGEKDSQTMLAGYFKNGGPIDGAIRIVGAGVLMNGHIALSGDALPADKAVSSAVKLSYPRKLPAETILYVAGSTKTGMKGADAKAQLLKSLEGTHVEKAKELSGELDAFEKEVGFTIADLFDMVGDEAAFAILVDRDVKYKKGASLPGAALKSLGAAFVMQVDDEAVAKKVLAKLRDKVSGPELAKVVTVKADGDGFVAQPTGDAAAMLSEGPLPSLHVKYAKKALSIVVAQAPLMGRTFAAIEDGTASLKDDDAHELAMKALRSEAHLYIWMDLGRMVSLAYAADPQDKEDARAFGVPVDAVKLAGPERMTAAVDFDYEVKNGEWTADVETLNLAGFSLLAGVDSPGLGGGHKDATNVDPGAAPGTTPGTTPGGGAAPAADDGSAPSLGVPACDQYLQRLRSCGKGGPAQASFEQAAEKTRQTWAKMPAANRKRMAKACTTMQASLDANPACK